MRKNAIKAAMNAAIPPFISNSLIDVSPLTTTPAPSAVLSLFREGDGDNVAVESTVVIVLDTYIDDIIIGETLLRLLFVPPPPPTPPLRDGLGEIEGDDPFDNDDVGEAVAVVELVAVFDNEAVGVVLDVTVLELEDVAVGVDDEEEVIDIVTLSVLLGDTGALGLLLILAPRERLDVGL
jgi:hypothetical protein